MQTQERDDEAADPALKIVIAQCLIVGTQRT